MIKHKFRVGVREVEWFRGRVLSVERENGRKSKYCVKYEVEEDVCYFSLLLDIEMGISLYVKMLTLKQ